jgi:hypothetical protein
MSSELSCEEEVEESETKNQTIRKRRQSVKISIEEYHVENDEMEADESPEETSDQVVNEIEETLKSFDDITKDIVSELKEQMENEEED